MKKKNSVLPKRILSNTPKSLSQKQLKTSLTPDVKQNQKKQAKKGKKTTQKVKIPSKPSKILQSEDLILSSSSNSSIDSLNYLKETKQMKEKVLSSLKTFKSATQEYIKTNNTFEEEVISFEQQVKNIKHEVDHLYLESNRSKDRISNLQKSQFKNLTAKNSPDLNSDEWISEARSYHTSPREIIDELKKEIGQIKETIGRNEEDNKDFEAENNQNKQIFEKIRLELTVDTSEIDHATCKACELF